MRMNAHAPRKSSAGSSGAMEASRSLQSTQPHRRPLLRANAARMDTVSSGPSIRPTLRLLLGPAQHVRYVQKPRIASHSLLIIEQHNARANQSDGKRLPGVSDTALIAYHPVRVAMPASSFFRSVRIE
jgi:hypothetical protein